MSKSESEQSIMKLSICVLAHNEEDEIGRCLDSVVAAGLSREDVVHIVVNGSRDNTENIVRAVASLDPRIRLHTLELGDKANAWDHYTFNVDHEGIQGHVFVDADVRIRQGSLSAIKAALAVQSEAIAFSTLPYGGRISDGWRKKMLSQGGFAGNFYALKQDTLLQIIDENWHLPVGLIGDDTFLKWILRRGFDPNAPDRAALVQLLPGAGFDYDSFSMTSFSGLRSMVKRQATYALRDLQVYLVVRHLRRNAQSHANDKNGQRLPRQISDLYEEVPFWGQLASPFGFSRLVARKILFPYTWLRARAMAGRPLTPSWYQISPQKLNGS